MNFFIIIVLLAFSPFIEKEEEKNIKVTLEICDNLFPFVEYEYDKNNLEIFFTDTIQRISHHPILEGLNISLDSAFSTTNRKDNSVSYILDSVKHLQRFEMHISVGVRKTDYQLSPSQFFSINSIKVKYVRRDKKWFYPLIYLYDREGNEILYFSSYIMSINMQPRRIRKLLRSCEY